MAEHLVLRVWNGSMWHTHAIYDYLMYDNVSRLVLFKKGSSFIHIRRAHVWLISKLGLYWSRIILDQNYHLIVLNKLSPFIMIMSKGSVTHVLQKLFIVYSHFSQIQMTPCSLLMVGPTALKWWGGWPWSVCPPVRWRRFVPRFGSTSQRLWPRSPLWKGEGVDMNKEEKGKPWTIKWLLKRWGPRLLRRFCWSNISYRWIFRTGGKRHDFDVFLHLSREGKKKMYQHMR